MSSPQQPPPQAETSQAAQAAVAIAVGLAMARLWSSLDLLNLRRSLPAFKAAVAQEVQQHAQASATLAARQYRTQRVLAGVGGGFTPVPADPPSVEQIAQAVDWAVQPLWDSAVPLASLTEAPEVERLVEIPEETKQAASSAIADAKARLAASTERLVLDAGRDTVVGNVGRDRKAKGWARVPEPGACSFCALLAARGAVYRSEKSASFRSHDNCRCHVEPMFTAYEPSARIREWQARYDAVARQIGYGKDGRVTAADMRKAFRQAHEGRPVDIGRGGQPTARKTSESSKPSAPAGRSPEQIQAELSALEKNVPQLSNDQQREWTQKRIDALRQQLNPQ